MAIDGQDIVNALLDAKRRGADSTKLAELHALLRGNPPIDILADHATRIGQIIQGTYKEERHISKAVRYWVDQTNGSFSTAECYKDLNIADPKSRATAQKALTRLLQEGIIERYSNKNGVYVLIPKATEQDMDYKNADPNNHIVFNWPLNIQRKTRIFPKSVIIVAGVTGTGKCHGQGTKILMFDGTVKKVEDVKVGDLLMGDDSTPRRVLSLASGDGELYRVKGKGTDYVCNEDHILCLRRTRTNRFREDGVTLRKDRSGEILEISIRDYLRASHKTKHIFKGYRVPVEFPSSSVPVEPYFLGLWLGDGHSASPIVTSADEEIATYLYQYAERLGLQVTAHRLPNNKASTYTITRKRGTIWTGRKSLKRKLRDLDVIDNKHIPHEYIRNDRETRLEVLAGIIDTDGYLSDLNGYTICLKSKRLCEDIVSLSRSLGFACYFIKPHIVNGETYHKISISGDTLQIPVRIPRKKSQERRQKKDTANYSITVTPEGPGRYYGFQIDGNGRYLLADYTVTHNTSFLLDFIYLNQQRWPIVLLNSEMAPEAMNYKLSQYDFPVDAWTFRMRRWRGRTDEIDPNGITVIDYLSAPPDKPYMIKEPIDKILTKLDQGICIIAIQKKKGSDWGMGGVWSAMDTTLNINLEFGRLEIAKNRFREADEFKGLDMRAFDVRAGHIVEKSGWYGDASEEDRKERKKKERKKARATKEADRQLSEYTEEAKQLFPESREPGDDTEFEKED